MVFDALCHNTDDHLRNHGFLWDGQGWSLTPAYDIVPQPVVESAPHFLMLRIGPEQSIPTKDAFLAVAPYFALSVGEARDLLREIQAVTAGWVEHFKACGVVAKDLEQLREASGRYDGGPTQDRDGLMNPTPKELLAATGWPSAQFQGPSSPPTSS